MPEIFEVGTIISSDTILSEDLLPRFENALRHAVACDTDADRRRRAQELLEEYDGRSLLQLEGETGYEMVDAMQDMLEEYAPEGCCFGTADGDGACFGFFCCHE